MRVKRAIQENNAFFGALFAAFVIFLILSVVTSTFLTMTNLTNVLRQASIQFILAAGMTIVLISGGLDLSVGSIVSICSTFLAITIKNYEWPLYFSVPLILLISAALGLFNGLVINFLKIPAMIGTLATMISYSGVALLFTSGYNVIIPRENPLVTLGNGTLFGIIPYSLILVVAIYLIISYSMKRTAYGRIMYGMGGNAEAVRLSGISVRLYSINSYVVSGIFAGIAAIVLTGRVASGGPTGGANMQMDAIASSVLGGVSVSGGVGNIWGTFLGVFILMMIQNGLNLLQVNAYWQIVSKGLVIIAAVGISSLSSIRVKR